MKETESDMPDDRPDDEAKPEALTQTVEFNLRYRIPTADCFRRNQPAILEGPKEGWSAAQTAIDFGCALLTTHNRIRDKHKLKDAVLAALLRRALVTAEGVWRLLAAGLEEAALGLCRTLIEIDVNMKLVVQDPTERMAKRLAAFHYYGYQMHGQKMLSDRETREKVLKEEDGIANTIEVARSYVRFLEEPVFDDVREDVRKSQYWHGFQNVREAFEAVSMSSDYRMTYDSFTFFVHDTNIDHDFTDVVEGQLRLKALVERNPSRVQISLATMTFRLYSILKSFVDDRGLPEEFQTVPQAASDQSDSPSTLDLDSFDGLTNLLLTSFPRSPQGARDS